MRLADWYRGCSLATVASLVLGIGGDVGHGSSSVVGITDCGLVLVLPNLVRGFTITISVFASYYYLTVTALAISMKLKKNFHTVLAPPVPRTYNSAVDHDQDQDHGSSLETFNTP